MLKIWLLVCIYEIVKLWNLNLAMIDIAKVLFVFFILAIPLAITIFKIGQKTIKNDFNGVKIRLWIGVSIAWIIISMYLVNQYLGEILTIIKNFV